MDVDNNALLAVTTDLPCSSADRIALRDGSTGPITSTTMSTSSRDDEFFDVVGEQVDRHAAVGGDAAHPDTAQHQGGTDAGREILGAVLDDADNLATDVAQPEYRYADHLFVTGHGSPHFQTQQIVDRLPAQDQAGTASAHRHHRGTADHVVTARQRITIGAGSGHPK